MFKQIVWTTEPRGGKLLKRYEILFIVQADLPDDELTELLNKYQNIITKSNGSVFKIEKWGLRRLAYEIKKQTKGIYIFIDFTGTPKTVPEIERNFKIDDKILKFLTVKKDDAQKTEAEMQTSEGKLPVKDDLSGKPEDTAAREAESANVDDDLLKEVKA